MVYPRKPRTDPTTTVSTNCAMAYVDLIIAHLFVLRKINLPSQRLIIYDSFRFLLKTSQNESHKNQ